MRALFVSLALHTLAGGLLLGLRSSAPPGDGGPSAHVEFDLQPSAEGLEPAEEELLEELPPELLAPELPPLPEPELVEQEVEEELLPALEDPPLEPIDDFALDLASVRWRPRPAPPAAEVAPPAPAPAEAGGEIEARLVHQTAPDYPLLSRQRGEQGSVDLELEIDEHGRVLAVRLLRSSGHPRLDGAALRAAQGWSFEPARRLGRPVPSVWRHRVTFRLDS